MRIVLALHQYLPEFSAGTEVLVHEIVHELQTRGHEVLVFAGSPVVVPMRDEERFEQQEVDGVEVLRFLHQHCPMGGENDILRQEYDSPIVGRRFARLIDEWKPDLVHFFNFARISTSPADACAAAGVPFIYTATDYWALCLTARLQREDGSPCGGPDMRAANCVEHLLEIKRPKLASVLKALPYSSAIISNGPRLPVLKNSHVSHMLNSIASRSAVIRERLNRAVAVLVPTSAMKDMLIDSGVAAERVRLQPYGIPDRSPTVRQRRRDAFALKVGYIGTLAYHKGVHDLVRAFRLLHDENLSLRIYGDTQQFPAYMAEVVTEVGNDDRIEFRGTFHSRDIDAVFDEIDVLIVPSIWKENSPLVVLEAQARCCPVLVARQPGLVDVIRNGENGLVFEAGNPDDMARTIKRVLDDRDLLGRLSANSAKIKSMGGYVNELVDLYSGVAC